MVPRIGKEGEEIFVDSRISSTQIFSIDILLIIRYMLFRRVIAL